MGNSIIGTFVITGAGGGIGRAAALELATLRHPVGLIGRSPNHLRHTCRLIEKSTSVCYAAEPVQIEDRREVRTAFRRIISKLGPLQGVIACAGTSGGSRSQGDRLWDRVIGTNLYGVYYTLTEALRHINPNPIDRKTFIVIGSLLARIGVKGAAAYCASKAGVGGLVRALAVELAERNVHVNVIHPGWVRTAMARRGLRRLSKAHELSFAETEQLYRDAVPLRRMSTPEEIAALIRFLVSGGDEGFTGASFDLNNGAWMG